MYLVFSSKRKFRSFVNTAASTRDDDEPIQSIYHVCETKMSFSKRKYINPVYTINRNLQNATKFYKRETK